MHEVLRVDERERLDLSGVDELPMDVDVTALDAQLSCEQVRLKLWQFGPGEEMRYHAHREQEEAYLVLDGRFSLKLGSPSASRSYAVGPGDAWMAGPETGHGHRYVGADEGLVLAVAAPAVDDDRVAPGAVHDG